MKRSALAVFFVTALFVVQAFSQEPGGGQGMGARRMQGAQAQDVRGNMLRQLGLSKEQIQRLRHVNAERRPQMDSAQARLREATRALDEAIYADQMVESDIQGRLKEMQLAQAEVFKIRTMNELAVRKILTPDQLMRFRTMRQRFENARNNMQNRPGMNRTLPVQNGNSLDEKKPAAKPGSKPLI